MQLAPTPEDLAPRLMAMIERLYPICRSITGDGVRETLAIIGETADLDVHEVPSGTRVLDWTVPPEWNITDAYIADDTGRRVVDFREHNLHVVSYSAPVRASMTLDELRPHLHSLPDQPDLIPYRTSYYDESWGFCLRHRDLEALSADGRYEVVVDSTLEPGSLTYGEVSIPGSDPAGAHGDDEILISTHVCHPSLCDDNLSGIAVAAHLAAALRDGPPPRRNVRFVFAPGTIGAITWLARNRDRVDRIVGGLTLTCLGDDHPFTYKRTERGDAPIDRAAVYVTARRPGTQVIDFFPYGYDERQYNSPGFRAPVGSLMRGRHGEFPEYHTSADDLDFVSSAQLVDAYRTVAEIVAVAAADRAYVSTEPYGEPQLGTRGLYGALGGTTIPDAQLAMLWILNQSDGTRRLLDIAERSGIDFDSIVATADVLVEHGLLHRAD